MFIYTLRDPRWVSHSWEWCWVERYRAQSCPLITEQQFFTKHINKRREINSTNTGISSSCPKPGHLNLAFSKNKNGTTMYLFSCTSWMFSIPIALLRRELKGPDFFLVGLFPGMIKDYREQEAEWANNQNIYHAFPHLHFHITVVRNK